LVEPYEDYVTVGETRFFFLRVPYSVIAELHRKAFSELRQPQSLAATNAPIDSVGFDFIQPPRVVTRFLRDDAFVLVRIEQFESDAFAATSSKENINDLAMVLVDRHYNGDCFVATDFFFANDLSAQGWEIRLPVGGLGDRLMFIYLDVFGNEHREARPLADFDIVDDVDTPDSSAVHASGVRRSIAAASKTPSKGAGRAKSKNGGQR
jgi:site-specific DNA-methyltransferase (adenine-specific)/adenine-specific DNA-methyltransferase